MRDQWYHNTQPEYLAYLGSKVWKDRRARVIERCDNTCERCGKFAVSEVHHLTYVRIYREELTDLQGVCEHCHDFLHGKRPDDGTAEYERHERRRGELRAQVEAGRSELRRLTEHPDRYRAFTASPISDDRELMRLLRQHPRVIGVRGEQYIFEVRYAKRRHGSAVAFKLGWHDADGKGWSNVADAAEWLRRGAVFEAERRVWVDVPNIRWFVDHYCDE